jgi:hypothetical protein
LRDTGSASSSGPIGYAFPSALAPASYEPPRHVPLAPGAAIARPLLGVIDVGAFEYR